VTSKETSFIDPVSQIFKHKLKFFASFLVLFLFLYVLLDLTLGSNKLGSLEVLKSTQGDLINKLNIEIKKTLLESEYMNDVCPFNKSLFSEESIYEDFFRSLEIYKQLSNGKFLSDSNNKSELRTISRNMRIKLHHKNSSSRRYIIHLSSSNEKLMIELVKELIDFANEDSRKKNIKKFDSIIHCINKIKLQTEDEISRLSSIHSNKEQLEKENVSELVSRLEIYNKLDLDSFSFGDQFGQFVFNFNSDKPNELLPKLIEEIKNNHLKVDIDGSTTKILSKILKVDVHAPTSKILSKIRKHERKAQHLIEKINKFEIIREKYFHKQEGINNFGSIDYENAVFESATRKSILLAYSLFLSLILNIAFFGFNRKKTA